MNKKNNLTILAVDLDHTLIKTDMIHLGIKYILKYKILLVISLLITFIFKGKPETRSFCMIIRLLILQNCHIIMMLLVI